MRVLRSSKLAAATLGVAVLAACSAKPEYSDISFNPVDNAPPRPTAFPSGPTPTYGPTTHLAEAPPPISGGTLLVTKSKIAVVADPDRDRIFVVDLADERVRTIEVAKRAEPGRAVEDAAGNVHVVLRNTGEVLTIDPKATSIVARRPVCSAPRGIALTSDADGPTLLIACAGGELQKLPTMVEKTVAKTARIADDLRDVVISGGRIYVSTFRSAEVLEVGDDLSVIGPLSLESPAAGNTIGPKIAQRTPRVAWRMIPGGTAAGTPPMVVHQLASNEPVPTEDSEPGPRTSGRPTGGSGYGSTSPAVGCGATADPVVVMSLSRPSNKFPLRVTNGFAALPVDVTTDGTNVTVVAAGNGHTPQRPQLFTYPLSFVTMPSDTVSDARFSKDPAMRNCTLDVGGSSAEVGQLVAATYLEKGHLLLQSREPAQLVRWPERTIIRLSDDSREDTGHAIFHSNSSAGISCASCHAEGGDDSHTWTFDVFGVRRTPSLRGTLEGTAPYHWSGDMDGLSTLADKVFTNRMRGPALDNGQKEVLQQWLFAQPPPNARPTHDATAIARGKALFESAAVGCAGCHNGPRMTSSASVDVGTGGVFQVPSLLGLGAHAPYLHDGCARTLRERFDPRCTTDKHGKTSTLSESEIDDLVGYLESL